MQHASEVAAFFRAHLPDLSVNKNRGVTLSPIAGGGRPLAADTLFPKLKEKLPQAAQAELHKQFAADLIFGAFTAPAFSQALHQAIVALMAPPPADLSKVYFGGMTTPLSEVEMLTLATSNSVAYLYDQKKDLLAPYHLKTLDGALKGQLGPAYGDWLATNGHVCEIGYVPFEPRRFKNPETDRTVFNRWRPADWWEEGWEPDPAATLPDEFEELYRHLFPKDVSYRTSLSWLRDCVHSRAEPVLVLLGSQGIGKNSFYEIAKGLVGVGNANKGSNKFHTSQFHGGLISGSRLLFLDETPLTSRFVGDLKDYANGEASLERKGKDVEKSEVIYASFMAANNNHDEMHVTPGDRKFYFPDVTNVRFPKAKGERICRKLVKDKDLLRRTAAWLYFNFEAGASASFEKTTDNFLEACIHSPKVGLETLFQLLRSRSVVTPSDYPLQYSRKTIYAVQRQIATFEHTFGRKFATFFIETTKEWSIKSHLCEAEDLGIGGAEK